MGLLEIFNQHFKQFFGYTYGQKILCAVSGGPDSMVMLDLLLKSNLTIGVAHCNYKLRGTDSDLDEELVINFCEEHSIPVFTRSFDTSNIAAINKSGIQETARNLRYEWFNQLLAEHQYHKIATAHHIDDNAETILFNLIRGTGMTGTSGIPANSNNIIRPLLGLSKNEILTYANQHAIPYRMDVSNEGTKYARNKIRNQVIPILTEINPNAVEHINDFAQHSKIANELIREKVAQLTSIYLEEVGNSLSLNCKSLFELPNYSFWLYELLKPWGCNQDIVNNVIEAVLSNRTGATFSTHSHRLIINRGFLLVFSLSENIEPLSLSIHCSDLPLQLNYDSQTIHLKMIQAEELPYLDVAEQYVDLDAAGDSFTLRNWSQGDKFYPLGMERSKKLSDYFTDKKMSIPAKKNTLILENATEIIAIIGHQISNNVKLTPHTKRILCIALKQ
jgi:tRNA(Ile)-lysidine synthase